MEQQRRLRLQQHGGCGGRRGEVTGSVGWSWVEAATARCSIGQHACFMPGFLVPPVRAVPVGAAGYYPASLQSLTLWQMRCKAATPYNPGNQSWAASALCWAPPVVGGTELA